MAAKEVDDCSQSIRQVRKCLRTLAAISRESVPVIQTQVEGSGIAEVTVRMRSVPLMENVPVMSVPKMVKRSLAVALSTPVKPPATLNSV